MGLSDVLLLIVVTLGIGIAYFIIEDTRKKGVPMCSKGCNGCPHPCHSDGTPKDDFAQPKDTVSSANEDAIPPKENK